MPSNSTARMSVPRRRRKESDRKNISPFHLLIWQWKCFLWRIFLFFSIVFGFRSRYVVVANGRSKFLWTRKKGNSSKCINACINLPWSGPASKNNSSAREMIFYAKRGTLGKGDVELLSAHEACYENRGTLSWLLFSPRHREPFIQFSADVYRERSQKIKVTRDGSLWDFWWKTPIEVVLKCC